MALQCNSAVAEHMSPKLGQWVGGAKKKYDKFNHRLNVGVEHRQMHRRASAPKQEQRVKKQKSHTVTLKKFRSLLKKIPLVSKTSQQLPNRSKELKNRRATL